MISRKVLIPMAAVAVIGAAGYGASRVSAAGDTSGHQSLVQQIADTFHLDPSKVQAVFDRNKAGRQTQAEARYEQMLSKAVSDGKITSGQKSAILTEHNALKSELDAAMSQTGTGRRTAMQQVRTEAQDWAKQNNVSARWLLAGRPLKGMGPSSSPTPSE